VDSHPVVVLQATLRTLGEASTRSVAEVAKRLRVVEAKVTAMVVPTAGPPGPADPPAPVPTSPLLAMRGPHAASAAPRLRLSRRAVLAARQSAIR
jgi:hypothetical protein